MVGHTITGESKVVERHGEPLTVYRAVCTCGWQSCFYELSRQVVSAVHHHVEQEARCTER